MKLRDLQQQLLHELVQPSEAPMRFIAPKQQQQRLAIYRNNILGARFSALQQIFPAVERLLGVEYFQQLLETFLKSMPSRHWRIEKGAPTFIEFVTGCDVVTSVPYLVDMLRFEWAWYQVFHGNSNEHSAEVLTTASMLQLADNVMLLSSEYPLHLLWEMCQAEYQGDFELPDQADKTYLALLQHQQCVEIRLLNKTTWQLVQELKTVMTLASLLDAYKLTKEELQTQLIETGLVQCFQT